MTVNSASTLSPPNLAPLLNARRKDKGMTLESLSSVSGVSRSMLSQIERGEASPTFSTLWNITRALDITLAELSSPEAAKIPQIDIVLDHFTPEIRTADGHCILRILSPTESAGTTEWYRLTIAPHGALESDPHSTGTIEHLTVLSGSLVVQVGTTVATIGAGETARYSADAPHVIRNTSSKSADALLVVMLK
jgi:XRE family transcriptional regulator, regulator of sulfur utilization